MANPGQFKPCPEICCDVGPLNANVSSELQTLTHGASDIPNGSSGVNPMPASVTSYTVTNEGGADVIVDTGNGIVTLHRIGSRTFGDGISRINTSGVSITTGANSNADIIWVG